MFKVRVVTEDEPVKNRLTEEVYTVYGVYREERTKYTFFIILNEDRFETYLYGRFAPITDGLFKVRLTTEDKSAKDRLPEEVYSVYGVYKEDGTSNISFLIWNKDKWEWHLYSEFSPIKDIITESIG